MPQRCEGLIEVMDQTIGCSECGMNLWEMPEFGQWPKWDLANEPPADWWERKHDWENGGSNPYTPYDELLHKVHPNGFKDED